MKIVLRAVRNIELRVESHLWDEVVDGFEEPLGHLIFVRDRIPYASNGRPISLLDNSMRLGCALALRRAQVALQAVKR